MKEAPHRPTDKELRDAYGREIADVISPGLDVLFVGINPSLYSGATGHHFARPGNRFWPTLHAAGFTDRLLHPSSLGCSGSFDIRSKTGEPGSLVGIYSMMQPEAPCR